MADIDPIEIKYQTTADLTGADDANASISATHAAELDAQRDEDVRTVKEKRAIEEEIAARKQLEKSIREIAVAQKALVAIAAADKLVQTLKDIQQIAPEGSKAAAAVGALGGTMDSLSVGMSTFVTTGNAYAAVAATVGSGIMTLVKEWGKMEGEIEKANTAVKRNGELLVSSADYYKQLANTVRQENISKTIDESTRAAKRLNDELKRKDDLAKAQASYDKTVSASEGAGLPNESQTAVNQVQDLKEQFEREKQATQAKFEAAREAFFNQSALVASFAEGTPIAQVDAAKSKLKDLSDEMTSLGNDLNNLGQINTLKLKEEAIKSSDTVQKEAEDLLTKNATALKTQIEAVVTAQNGVVSEPVKKALEGANKILLDGKADATEAKDLENAIRQFKTSREAADQQTQKWLQSLITNEQEIVSKMNGFQKQIDAIKDDVARIQS